MKKNIISLEVVHAFLIIIVAACVGAEDDKIIGGIRTGLIPFMISVQRSGRHYCGGTLLSYYFTLTACHCVGHFDYPSDGNKSVLILVRYPASTFLLQAGDWILYFNSKRAQRRDAKQFHVHPSCSKVDGVVIYDFALIEVTEAFSRTEYVQPLRLARNKEFYTQRMIQIKNKKYVCWVIGWGKKDIDPSTPHENQFLKKAKMRLIWDSQCQQMLGIQNNLFATYNFSGNGQVCAVGVNWKESDCTGDSGGPVWCRGAINSPSRARLYFQYLSVNTTPSYISARPVCQCFAYLLPDSIMALVSYGFECGRGDQPAVYAKIEQFIDWWAQETPQIREREANPVARAEFDVFLILCLNLVTEMFRNSPRK